MFEGAMDVFLMVGLPFATFRIPVAWAAYGIGGSGADPFQKPAAPTGRVRRDTGGGVRL